MSDFGPEAEKLVDFDYEKFAIIADSLRVGYAEPLTHAAFQQETSRWLANITTPMIEQGEETP